MAPNIAFVRDGLRYQAMGLSWRYAGLAHEKRGVRLQGKLSGDRHQLGTSGVSQPPELMHQVVNEGSLLAVLPEHLQEVAMNEVPFLIVGPRGAAVMPRVGTSDPTAADVLGNMMNGAFTTLPMSLDGDLSAVFNAWRRRFTKS